MRKNFTSLTLELFYKFKKIIFLITLVQLLAITSFPATISANNILEEKPSSIFESTKPNKAVKQSDDGTEIIAILRKRMNEIIEKNIAIKKDKEKPADRNKPQNKKTYQGFGNPELNPSARSSNTKLIAKFQDWSLFEAKFENNNFCYLTSTPLKRTGNDNYQGEPYFLVINLFEEGDEITVANGSIYHNLSEIELSFGAKKFYLKPFKTLAWTEIKKDDIEIIKQMQNSLDFTAYSKNFKEETAEDYYSLLGFKMAYNEMKDKCNNQKINP